MSGGYERSKFKNGGAGNDGGEDSRAGSAASAAGGSDQLSTSPSSTPTNIKKSKKPTSIPAQLKRNRDLAKELDCLKDILGQFQDQNDDLMETAEKENASKQEIVKSPQREFVIQECLQIYDELGSLGEGF